MAIGKPDLGGFFTSCITEGFFLELKLVFFEIRFALGFWFLGYQRLQKHTKIVYKQKIVFQTIKE